MTSVRITADEVRQQLRDLREAADNGPSDDPDAPWCPGCGFANYSASPCEVCGYDDQNPEACNRVGDYLDEHPEHRQAMVEAFRAMVDLPDAT